MVVLGHSWGGDKANEVLKLLTAKISDAGLAGKVAIAFFPMDAISRTRPGKPTARTDMLKQGGGLATFNFYEKGDLPYMALPPIRGTDYPDLDAEDAESNRLMDEQLKEAGVPPEKYHELLPKVVEDDITELLGLEDLP